MCRGLCTIWEWWRLQKPVILMNRLSLMVCVLDCLICFVTENLCAGSHPVIVLMRKVATLASTRCDQVSGSVFYVSVIQFLYTVCQAFPSVYLSTIIGMPDYLDYSASFFHIPASMCSSLLLLPIELLDSIFCHVPWSDLLHSHITCWRWCQVATRFTHAHLVLHLSPDWQVAIVNAGGTASFMDDNALTQYVAMTYFIVYWGIVPYILSVSYINWPCLQVCFFYRLLPNMTAFSCKSTGCTYHNISSVSSPFVLPPSVSTVRLVRCSMQHHSIERMLHYLMGLHTLELRGVLYGHIVSVCFPTPPISILPCTDIKYVAYA